MQANPGDPFTFVLLLLGFLTVFWVIMYFKGLMWFQQTDTNTTDNWFISLEARDAASGSWLRRFGRPALVLFFVHLLSYYIITNLVELSPFQLFVFIFVYYIPTDIILGVVFIVIFWRIHKQPRITESEHPIEDPFPDDDSG